ncbi:MAG: hypothetical protein ACRCVE_01555 [Plesiomonas sp.]
MKLICTIGSCLSANVGYQLKNTMSDWHRVSSVQHNRIDQFSSIYIERKTPEISLKDIDFELSEKYSYVNVIDNQIRWVGLGLSLPKEDEKIPLMDIMNCINSGKVDVFIFDNFAELFFKVYRHIETSSLMFINEGYLTKKTKKFNFINAFISEDEFKESYNAVFNYITKKNPQAKIVFIPFPTTQITNNILAERSRRQIDCIRQISSTRKNIIMLEEKLITDYDLKKTDDKYHFTDLCYKTYSKELIINIL